MSVPAVSAWAAYATRTSEQPNGAVSAAGERGASADPNGKSTESQADASSPVRVSASVEPKDVTIGTPFRFTIRIESAPGVDVAVPLLSDHLGEYSIVDFGHRDTVTNGDGSRVTEHWYDLVAYETGSQFVPAVPLAYKAAGAELATTETPKVVVNVASLITKAGGADDIPAIRDAVPILSRTPSVWWLLGAGAAGALIVLVAYRSWRRARKPLAPPARAAHEIALEALEQLRAEKLIEHGRHDPYYVALTDIVRHYVEARFRLHAPEMTTDEFLAAVHRSRDLITAHRSALQEFLAEADLVKFARHVPTPDRAERAWTAAHDFVDATRPVEDDRAAA